MKNWLIGFLKKSDGGSVLLTAVSTIANRIQSRSELCTRHFITQWSVVHIRNYQSRAFGNSDRPNQNFSTTVVRLYWTMREFSISARFTSESPACQTWTRMKVRQRMRIQAIYWQAWPLQSQSTSMPPVLVLFRKSVWQGSQGSEEFLSEVDRDDSACNSCDTVRRSLVLDCLANVLTRTVETGGLEVQTFLEDHWTKRIPQISISPMLYANAWAVNKTWMCPPLLWSSRCLCLCNLGRNQSSTHW